MGLAIERSLDALPGFAWCNAALVWRAHSCGHMRKHKLLGCEVQIVEHSGGHNAVLFVSAGSRWKAVNVKRGPWRWLYRRWVDATARKERAENGREA